MRAELGRGHSKAALEHMDTVCYWRHSSCQICQSLQSNIDLQPENQRALRKTTCICWALYWAFSQQVMQSTLQWEQWEWHRGGSLHPLFSGFTHHEGRHSKIFLGEVNNVANNRAWVSDIGFWSAKGGHHLHSQREQNQTKCFSPSQAGEKLSGFKNDGLGHWHDNLTKQREIGAKEGKRCHRRVGGHIISRCSHMKGRFRGILWKKCKEMIHVSI